MHKSANFTVNVSFCFFVFGMESALAFHNIVQEPTFCLRLGLPYNNMYLLTE